MNKIDVLGKILHLQEGLSQEAKVNFSPELKDFQRQFFTLDRMSLPHSGRKMLIIIQEKGAINQRQLAQEVRISPQAASESVKKLELSGCVQKVNGKKKNEKLISLTDLGLEIAQLLHEIIALHAKQLFQEFSPEEIDQLGVLIDKLHLEITPSPKL